MTVHLPPAFVPIDRHEWSALMRARISARLVRVRRSRRADLARGLDVITTLDHVTRADPADYPCDRCGHQIDADEPMGAAVETYATPQGGRLFLTIALCLPCARAEGLPIDRHPGTGTEGSQR